MKSEIVSQIFFSLIIFFGVSCNNEKQSHTYLINKNVTPILEEPAKHQADTLNRNAPFINRKYKDIKPLAQLINMPNYADLSTAFEVIKNEKAHIYAVGEMINSLANVKRKYFLANEDIEFYFNLKNDKSDFCNKKRDNQQYIFTIVEGYTGGINSIKKGLTFKTSIDSVNNKYWAEIKIPWKNLGCIHPRNELEIGFDIALAHNYCGLFQDKKIAWTNSKDIMLSTTKCYGTLVLKSQSTSEIKSGFIYSIYKDSETLSTNSLSTIKVDKVVAGEVNEKHNFFSIVKSSWDKSNLYFLIETHEGIPYYKQRYITPEKRNKLQTFADYGWIEDDKGNTVWNMNVLHSKYAGGSVKNQKIDTTIFLKAGKYILKYHTDESHSYNNWDDDPPKTPFYGIKVYKSIP
jgi:hypothetical protein